MEERLTKVETGFNDIKSEILKISLLTRYEFEYPYLTNNDAENSSQN